jgi:translation elongation factor EF-Tu-like GTPase
VRDHVQVTELPTGQFRLRVEQAFNITGRGTAVVGVLEQGDLRVGDSVRLVRGEGGPVAVCVGLDHAPRDAKGEGEPLKVGLILPALDAANIEPGDLIARA